LGDYDRKLYGRNWEDCQAQVPVYGSTVIEKGALLFIDAANGLRDFGLSTASHRAFPFSEMSGVTRSLASNVGLAATYFLGVAAWHSDSGVTGDLSVWTWGLFDYPLKNSRFVKPLLRIVPCGSGITLYNQKLAVDNSGSTKYIGLCAEYGKFKSSVQAVLRSRRLDNWTLD